MGELHCLNVEFGDATVIRTGIHTILVDTHNISDHSGLLPSNGILSGVFVTHQHRDHYSGLEYLWNAGFRINNLIYSPYDRRVGDNSVTLDEWNEFNGLAQRFSSRGTKLIKPYRQADVSKPWWELDELAFTIIGPHSSIASAETRELHDACLVITAFLGKRKCVFTGDASDTNLAWIAQNTTRFCDDILHGSHHGSINGADLEFIKKAKAQYTVISTRSGVHSNVPHPTALKRYRENTACKVYRTDVDGNLKFRF